MRQMSIKQYIDEITFLERELRSMSLDQGHYVDAPYFSGFLSETGLTTTATKHFVTRLMSLFVSERGIRHCKFSYTRSRDSPQLFKDAAPDNW